MIQILVFQAMLNKAHIKLNAKKLYAADGHAVKVGGTKTRRFQDGAASSHARLACDTETMPNTFCTRE